MSDYTIISHIFKSLIGYRGSSATSIKFLLPPFTHYHLWMFMVPGMMFPFPNFIGLHAFVKMHSPFYFFPKFHAENEWKKTTVAYKRPENFTISSLSLFFYLFSSELTWNVNEESVVATLMKSCQHVTLRQLSSFRIRK